MKRRHHIALITILFFGIVLLSAQRRDELITFETTTRSKHGSSEDASRRKHSEEAAHNLASGESTGLNDHVVHSGTSTGQKLDSESVLVPSTSNGDDAPPLVLSPEVGKEVNLEAPAALSLPLEFNNEVPIKDEEFPFQKDLYLELPSEILQRFSNHKPHNYDTNTPQTYAYATFMATRNPSIKDPYFLGIQSLIYRVLWSQRTRSQQYPFIAFVAEYVTPEQRALLRGAGAIVRELSPLEWTPNVPGVSKRWKDLFAKLNMWNEVEFQRILFSDADAFPLANIDEMFELAPMQTCDETKMQIDDFLADRTPVCESYIFAGVPQDPLVSLNSNINVGSMVFTPSSRMHKRLLQNYVKTDHYDCRMAEQAFLDWQFSPNGAFPAAPLDRVWGGFFPKEEEEGKLKVVHEKIWVAEEGWLKKEWERTWEEMLAFYSSASFAEAREATGIAGVML